MGSAIGGISSMVQYKKSKKQLKQMEERQAESEEQSRRLTPAEATEAEGGADSEAAMKQKRKGVQSTFTAKKKQLSSTGSDGEASLG